MLYRIFRSHRWLYSLISLGIVLGIFFGQPFIAQSLDWASIIQKGIQVIQVSNISDDQETEIGKQLNDRISQQMKVSSTSDLAKYVNEIGQKLIPYSKRPKLRYTFQVVEDKSINAFATLGGYVYIHTGVIQTADDEAQLASVIGHEMGHIEAKHSVKRLQSAAKAELGLSAIGIKTGTLVNIAYELVINRPNSRQAELEADTIGLNTMTQAGYAPQSMVAFMRKLMDDKQPNVPTILSTHPATSDRVSALEKQIANKSKQTGGTDTIAYARRVGKTATSKTTTTTPAPSPTPSPSPSVNPSPIPSPTKSGSDVIVPTN